MYRSVRKNQQNQKGNAILITTVILLVLSIIVASSINLSGMALDLAVFKRNTSNTYYLATSAIEKQVDTMNRAIETKIAQIIESEVTPNYINADGIIQEHVKYDTDKQILTASDQMKENLQTAIYEHLKENYVSTDGVDKSIKYEAQGDRTDDNSSTQISIEVSTKDANGTILTDDKLRIIATATTYNGSQVYDEQTAEAIIKITLPDNLENQIHERYNWECGVPDVLNSAILCYSDILVSGSGTLTVQQDAEKKYSGDVRVGGTLQVEGTKKDDIMVYPEVDQNGGVIAINGGTIDIKKNLYTTRNILATNGWNNNNRSNPTSITVGEDAIAYTIGLVDDFYEGSDNQSPYTEANQVKQTTINISQNAMVDNDVMIDRWVNGGKIKVGQTIFGVGGGTSAQTDPNQSSGVFSQGPGSIIEAKRMYVGGQPFITFGTQNPIRLWESIGEPFEGVASWEGYAIGTDTKQNASYLDPDSPFISQISKDKIRTNFEKTYAIAKVSGIDSNAGNAQKMGQECKDVFGINEINAWHFLFMTATPTNAEIQKFMDQINPNYQVKVNTVLGQTADKNFSGTTEYSSRNLGNPAEATYEGLKGYMSVMRAMLYKGVSENGLLNDAKFSDIVALSKVQTDSNTWSYATPIEFGNENIELGNYYVSDNADETIEEYPYPTIIFNKNPDTTLKISASGQKDTLNGWIISAGPVELGAGVKINGGIIVGGPQQTLTNREDIFTGQNAGIIVKDGTVEITHNPQVLLDVQVKNHKLYREILDALQLTNYANEDLKKILEEQGISTKAALKYTKDSILEVDTTGINISIESLKAK